MTREMEVVLIDSQGREVSERQTCGVETIEDSDGLTVSLNHEPLTFTSVAPAYGIEIRFYDDDRMMFHEVLPFVLHPGEAVQH